MGQRHAPNEVHLEGALSQHRELCKAKLGRVVLMGGVEVVDGDVRRDAEGFMTPDKAQNNTFDWEAVLN